MASNKTITINGRLYDAATGLPVKEGAEKVILPAPATAPSPIAAPVTKPAAPMAHPVPVPKSAATPRKSGTPRAVQNSTAVHSTTTQRGATLSRRVTKKPVAPVKPLARKPGRLMDVSPQSSHISHFAPHPVIDPAKKTPVAPRPTAAKATKVTRATAKSVVQPAAKPAARSATQKPTAKPATAKQIKDAQIEKALAPTPKPKKQPRKAKKIGWLSKRSRRLLIIIGFVVIIGLIIFAIYRFVPSISVGVAASQAGVSATYPQFTPDGYTLKQPVEYSDGQVVLSFNSNSNNNNYTITQTRSSWDSSAVLDNVVKPKVDDNYVTTKERGLTIYSYNNFKDTSWVNGGVLYTINSSSTLSGDQIRKIATSL